MTSQTHTNPQDQANKTKLIWGLISLIAPTVLIVATFLAYGIVNFIFGMTTNSIPSEPSVVKALLNVILFILGSLGVIAWLPGVVVGIILLVSRKKV